MADYNHALDELDIQEHKARIGTLKANLHAHISARGDEFFNEINEILLRNERSCLAQVKQVLATEADWVVELTELLKKNIEAKGNELTDNSL